MPGRFHSFFWILCLQRWFASKYLAGRGCGSDWFGLYEHHHLWCLRCHHSHVYHIYRGHHKQTFAMLESAGHHQWRTGWNGKPAFRPSSSSTWTSQVIHVRWIAWAGAEDGVWWTSAAISLQRCVFRQGRLLQNYWPPKSVTGATLMPFPMQMC